MGDVNKDTMKTGGHTKSDCDGMVIVIVPRIFCIAVGDLLVVRSGLE
jgi:hypothetical protein